MDRDHDVILHTIVLAVDEKKITKDKIIISLIL